MPIFGRLQVPATARRGESVEVRLLIQHAMETGFRREADGRAVPMNVVNMVTCRHAGRDVLRVELGSGISANPYFSFWLRAVDSGEVSVEWVDDAGERGSARATITVS
jgi:sulfur-oxidizing protein SoxZ